MIWAAFEVHGRIPPTVLFSVLGVIEDVTTVVTMDGARTEHTAQQGHGDGISGRFFGRRFGRVGSIREPLSRLAFRRARLRLDLDLRPRKEG